MKPPDSDSQFPDLNDSSENQRLQEQEEDKYEVDAVVFNRVDTTVQEVSRDLDTASENSDGLPIKRYKQELVNAVENYDVVVLVAETGAGKSTQMPQYLFEQGYKVIVTQPRRIASRSLSERVAEEMNVELGTTVGFRTARESNDSLDTRVLYCTDGLQLVRELTGNGIESGEKVVLMLDEVHEMNLNMEVLLAWIKKRRKEGADIKIVISSATIDADRLARFFEEGDNEVPVIEVPGRLFPVEKRQAPANELVSSTVQLAAEGRNVLVFMPGKPEIEEVIDEFEKSGVDAVILPLHGELTPEEQDLVFQHYGKPKIVVSTNVAQTSITIDDIDAIVDSGREKRIEVKDGIEGLCLNDISRADCNQRAGRAGRCRSGIYVLCSDVPYESKEREEFPTPDIKRVRLDQMVLRLAVTGIDATELEFLNQPEYEDLLKTKRALKVLGAMEENEAVTHLGHKISKLPISVHTGRMVIEALQRGCIDDVLTIASCLEHRTIRAHTKSGMPQLWRQFTRERNSDMLAELDLFEAASQMVSEAEMEANGIAPKSFMLTQETREHLKESLELVGFEFGCDHNNGNRKQILKSILSGMIDHIYLYRFKRRGKYADKNGNIRVKCHKSVLGWDPNWIVGIPADVEYEKIRKNRANGEVTVSLQNIPLITMCSEIDHRWLEELAPHLFNNKKQKKEKRKHRQLKRRGRKQYHNRKRFCGRR